MRITDGILNETSLKTGISLTGNTLASQLSGSPSDSLVNSLGDKGSPTLKGLSAEKYKKLEEAAKKLERKADLLKKAGKDSIFEEARKSGDSSEICQEISNLVSAYNEMMDRLRTDTSAMGMFYKKSLQDVVTEHKEALGELGITADKNGKLKADQEKLKNADLDNMEKLLGGSGTFTQQLSLIAGKIADNAQANLKSVSSQYNAAGNSVDMLLKNFDSRG